MSNNKSVEWKSSDSNNFEFKIIFPFTGYAPLSIECENQKTFENIMAEVDEIKNDIHNSMRVNAWFWKELAKE